MYRAIHIATLTALLAHGMFGCCMHHAHAGQTSDVAKVRVGQACPHHGHHGHDHGLPEGERPDDVPMGDPCHDDWCVFDNPRANTQVSVSPLWYSHGAVDSPSRFTVANGCGRRGVFFDDGIFARPGAILLQKQSLLL